jgi:type II secretory pathway pseudopilin PulG
MTTMTTSNCGNSGTRRESGFTLVETIISLALLTTALLSLAAVFTQGMKMISGSSGDLVLVQKATEAIESVFTARDTRVLSWSQIRNIVGDGQSTGGIFRDGAQPVKDPGPDGMVNTSDDGAIEVARLPGRDNRLNTADDEFITLTDYTREIEIRDISASLRQIRVIVRYRPGGTASGATVQEFILVSYISTYA